MNGRSRRLGALDLGTNSFHVVVAEAGEAGALRTITREKEMLRLGDVVAATGRIGPEATHRAIEAIVRLTDVARAQGVDEVEACATAAIREAEDGSDFVETAREETGVEIEVISGEREAQLVFEAVQASVDFDGQRAVAVDVGGGSVELAVGSQASLDWATSLRLGVGRLTATFVTSDPLRGKERRALDAHIRATLAPAVEEARLHGYDFAVGSSGTLLSFARMAQHMDDYSDTATGLTGYRLDAAAMRDLCKDLLKSDGAARAKIPGIEPKRSDLMPAAAVLVLAILDECGLDEMVFTDWGLREGILLRQVAHPVFSARDPKRIRARAISDLGARHRFDELHGRQTARLTLALFDELHELLGLGSEHRELLGHAAMIHDVGNVVARRGHHRHGSYILRHAELAGFEPDQRALLTALVRYHRRGEPDEDDPELRALGPDERAVLRPLVAVLRIADGLDSSRHGNVLGLDVRIDADLILIRTVSTSGDPGLDLWGGRRKADLLEKVTQHRVVIVGPDEVSPPGTVRDRV
ncbi:MAG: Ppx/GppA family phosphatase [Acidimicrobiia bacterium]|nr:Ppx/GppA family phosphatase [Acidimicrobiia bacterium]